MGGKSTKKISSEHFLNKCKELTSSYNYDFSNTQYINIRTVVEIKCLLHGKFFKNPNSILNGLGCKICDVIAGRSRSHLSVDEYKIVASTLHNNKYDYSKINTNSEKIDIICPKHGKFSTRRSAHISPSQLYGCQKCSRGYSKSEKEIERLLNEYRLKYVYQKTFDDLISSNNQKFAFDFYVPGKKLLIEFDGSHHYQLVKFGKNQTKESQEQKYEQIIRNDHIKNMYVFDNDLKLLRIKYTRANDIEKILLTELFSCFINDRNFDSALYTRRETDGIKSGLLIYYG